MNTMLGELQVKVMNVITLWCIVIESYITVTNLLRRREGSVCTCLLA